MLHINFLLRLLQIVSGNHSGQQSAEDQQCQLLSPFCFVSFNTYILCTSLRVLSSKAVGMIHNSMTMECSKQIEESWKNSHYTLIHQILRKKPTTGSHRLKFVAENMTKFLWGNSTDRTILFVKSKWPLPYPWHQEYKCKSLFPPKTLEDTLIIHKTVSSWVLTLLIAVLFKPAQPEINEFQYKMKMNIQWSDAPAPVVGSFCYHT